MAEILSRRTIYRGSFLTFEEQQVVLPTGSRTTLEVVRHPGATAIVAVTKGTVILVRQYRHATGEWLLEVPAGKLDVDEEIEKCAVRELEEETGYRARSLISMGWIWTTPGFSNERIWLFLARSLMATRQQLDTDEVLSVEKVPIADALHMARSGEINDGKSICALLRAEPHLL